MILLTYSFPLRSLNRNLSYSIVCRQVRQWMPVYLFLATLTNFLQQPYSCFQIFETIFWKPILVALPNFCLFGTETKLYTSLRPLNTSCTVCSVPECPKCFYKFFAERDTRTVQDIQATWAIHFQVAIVWGIVSHFMLNILPKSNEPYLHTNFLNKFINLIPSDTAHYLHVYFHRLHIQSVTHFTDQHYWEYAALRFVHNASSLIAQFSPNLV